MELITKEHFVKTDDLNLIQEFNDLTFQLNRELFRYSLDEILIKYKRLKQLNDLLGVGELVQLSLFD